MSNNFERHTSCLISGNPDLYPLKGYENHYLVKSRKTGFVFCERIPSQNELIKHYQKYNRNYSLPESTLKKYRQILKEKLEPFRKNNRILDVGCGDGHFLEVAKELGWEVYGTEYVDDVVSICREKGIYVHQGKLDPDNYEDGFFDVITSFEVIEHINNPREEINNIRKILRKGGGLYITTPNFNALERFILKDKYDIVITYPDHLSYYTPKTIDYLLKNSGFKKLELKTTGVRISSLLNNRASLKAENKTSTSSVDEDLRDMVNSNKLFDSLKNTINFFLSLGGIGNALKCLYIKD